LNYSRSLLFIVLLGLTFLAPFASFAAEVEVFPAGGGEGIQLALDKASVGGEVVLDQGTYLVNYPIFLRQDKQTLRGAGPRTILRLADNANCPVVVLGAPLEVTNSLRRGLHLSNLLVDGNRKHQQREDWRRIPDGSWMENNGVVVWKVEDAAIDHTTCCRGRSGGLVSTAGTRRLTVQDYTAYDNQFDGLACYDTQGSHFSQLNLHDNLAAGISLDLNFVSNIVDGAALTGNGLGIFMRQSRDNVFDGAIIRHCKHDGVFMAQAGGWTQLGWRLFPDTECTGNNFNDLRVENCAGRAFRVNDASCTNNRISGAVFLHNVRGGLSQPSSNPVTSSALIERP
jgi:hypothetical protein